MKEQEERVHNMTAELEIQYRKDSSILNWWWSYFTTPSGKGIDFITGGILVILTVGIVYLWRRVSVLTTTVLVLLQARKIQALELVFSPSKDGLNKTYRVTEDAKDVAEPFLSNYRMFGFVSMIMLSTIGMVLVCLVYLVYRRHSQQPKLSCHIGLNFACAGESKMINLMKCDTIIEDVTVQTTQPPRGLQVMGYLRPVLIYDWDAVITITSLQSGLSLPPYVSISYKEAAFIRRVLTIQHRIVPVIFSRGVVRVIRKTVHKDKNRGQIQSNAPRSQLYATLKEPGGHLAVTHL